jgi:hypothetical protein
MQVFRSDHVSLPVKIDPAAVPNQIRLGNSVVQHLSGPYAGAKKDPVVYSSLSKLLMISSALLVLTLAWGLWDRKCTAYAHGRAIRRASSGLLAI